MKSDDGLVRHTANLINTQLQLGVERARRERASINTQLQLGVERANRELASTRTPH